MNIDGKNILITAGPTWVPIDKVRVISNIATGDTGIRLAKEARRRGANVTLLLGPIGSVTMSRSIIVRRFCYFNQLAELVKRELTTSKYDIVIHSAAVSDYKPKKQFYRKLRSDIQNFRLEFETTVKIVDKIKRYAPRVFLIIFKLEFDARRTTMLRKARVTMRESRADIAVVNTFSPQIPYKAYIIDQRQQYCEIRSKKKLVECLLRLPIMLA